MCFGGKFLVGRFSLTEVYKPLMMIVKTQVKAFEVFGAKFSANGFWREISRWTFFADGNLQAVDDVRLKHK